jgi:hypothetical protein
MNTQKQIHVNGVRILLNYSHVTQYFNINVAQILQKLSSHLKILGVRRMTCSKFHAQDPQILGAIAQNLVAQATWQPAVLLPWLR